MESSIDVFVTIGLDRLLMEAVIAPYSFFPLLLEAIAAYAIKAPWNKVLKVASGTENFPVRSAEAAINESRGKKSQRFNAGNDEERFGD